MLVFVVTFEFVSEDGLTFSGSPQAVFTTHRAAKEHIESVVSQNTDDEWTVHYSLVSLIVDDTDTAPEILEWE